MKARTLGGCRFVPWRGRVLVLREIGRAAEPAVLDPGRAVLWDGRFALDLPRSAAQEIVVGYLGRSGAAELGRRRPRLALPPLLRPVLPAAWDRRGLLAVPHVHYLRDRSAVIPRIVFRPPHALTSADFTVVST